MNKTVCDICGKDAMRNMCNKRYIIPMECIYTTNFDEYVIHEYKMIEPVEVDLCQDCAQTIVGVIGTLNKKK